MLSSVEIRNVKFAKAMGGYKQEEVDIFLDKIETDYALFERVIKEYKDKIDSLNKELESTKLTESSIQSVLINAQKLSEQIIEDAKAKSKEIVSEAESSIVLLTEKEKELSTAIEIEAQERRSKLEAELEEMVKKAQIKAESFKAAAEDAVARQQLLFDKLRIEVVAFKANVTSKYKEHFDLLQSIPDFVPMDPKHMADVVSLVIDKYPEPESFIKLPEEDSACEIAEEQINSESGASNTAEELPTMVIEAN